MRNLTTVAQAVSAEAYQRARHLPTGDHDRLVIDSYLIAAQAVVEAACGRPLSERDVAFSVVAGGWSRWWFPIVPVVSISKVEVLDGLGGSEEMEMGNIRLNRKHDEPQMVLLNSARLSDGCELEITARVGGASSVHKPQMVQAIILIASEWYDAGITPEGGLQASDMSFAALNLIKQVRYQRPCEFGVM